MYIKNKNTEEERKERECVQQGWHLRCGVQADAVGLRGRCRLVIGGEDRQAGGGVDHMIDQVANGRRA